MHKYSTANCFDPNKELPTNFPFNADSAIRQKAEPIAIGMIATIAGMDVAHPSIAQGVANHSSYKTEPWKRGLATSDAILALVFGNKEESLAQAKSIHKIHAHINDKHSAIDNQVYDANDNNLQHWVLATGFYGIETAYSRWVKPLTPEDRQLLYTDLITFGEFFGINKNIIPRQVSEHDNYMDSMLNGNLLGSTNISNSMVKNVFTFRHRTLPLPIAYIIKAISRTSLDPRFQTRFGVEPNVRDKAIAASFDLAIGRTYRLIPE